MKGFTKVTDALMRLAFVIFGASMTAGCNHCAIRASGSNSAIFQRDMDAYCTTKLNDSVLATLSSEDKAASKYEAFFSMRLHSCLETIATRSPKNLGPIITR